MSMREKILQLKQDIDVVYESGKSAYAKEWWNKYQKGHLEGNYLAGAFAGRMWTEDTFNPKYDIAPKKEADYMFLFNNVQDLESALNKAGVKLDLSKCISLNSLFQNYLGKIIPEISTISASNLINLFAYAGTNLTTIRKLILKADGSQNITGCFTNCVKLENISIEGVIGQNFDIKNSPLTKESIESIVGALSDTATGKTCTLNKSAREFAFIDDEWADLIESKPNWTFSLI